MRASEERLRLLLDSTGEGIYALDLEGKCVMCNRAAVRLLGYREANELLGQPIHQLIHHTHGDGRAYPPEECRSHLAARQGVGIEVDDEIYWRADGTSFPVEYRSYPVERAGQPVGSVVTFTDITTRRGLEGQIRQSQKMEAVGRLAAGVAHDFNNLLTVINGYTDLLLDEGQGESSAMTPSTLERLEMVRKSGERAATLTHQLLAFSRQQVLQPQILDLNHTVREMEPLLRRTLGENIELTVALTSPLHPVKADPSQVDQILMNLVVNARDATAAGQHGDRPGSIRIETANVKLDAAFVRPHAGLTAGAYVRLSVRDTGMGMRPETQAHVFEPFFTTKPQGQGTGLGLPTVFGIVRQSGGTVMVESTWGRGTSMQVFLPAYAGNGVVTLPTERGIEPQRAAGGPEVVLVVEDEDGLRRLMIEILRERGYRVLDAGHPDQALRLSLRHEGEIQLLITDIVMPAMNGRALAERIQAQRPG
ncbi:MAG: ATP-binding protein, partial [Terriglobales bacterium]